MEIGLFCKVIFDIVNHLQNRINMKRTISIIILLMSFLSNLWSQGYDNLWKKVNNAERDDQPRTQISILTQIQERAAQENAYGHLLASTLRRASLEYDISPDSLSKWVTDLEEKESQATNVVLQSIYDVVLSQIYDAHPALDDHKAKASAYRAKALSHPDALAAERVDPYIPFLKKGVDSQIFGNDLLHVVALETNQREWLLDWYRTHGNREASCLLATDLVGNDLQALDRIIAEYQDLQPSFASTQCLKRPTMNGRLAMILHSRPLDVGVSGRRSVHFAIALNTSSGHALPQTCRTSSFIRISL